MSARKVSVGDKEFTYDLMGDLTKKDGVVQGSITLGGRAFTTSVYSKARFVDAAIVRCIKKWQEQEQEQERAKLQRWNAGKPIGG